MIDALSGDSYHTGSVTVRPYDGRDLTAGQVAAYPSGYSSRLSGVLHSDMISILHTFDSFTPRLIDIDELTIIPNHEFLVYGEVHGAIENAHVVYTLCHKLSIDTLAVEYSRSVDGFIRSAVNGNLDLTGLDQAMFDSSILSLEMLKTIIELLRNGAVKQIRYIDPTFDYTEEKSLTLTSADRESAIADAILELKGKERTLCILGNWHTRRIKTGAHISALMRVRQILPDTVSICTKYRQGSVCNDGKIIELPLKNHIPERYVVAPVSDRDYDLSVPIAHPIFIPKTH